MAASNTGQQWEFLVNAAATPRQKQLAAIIAIVALMAFLLAAPFARVPLAQVPAFIVSYQAALFAIHMITAVMLYEQFVRLRSPAVLILAAGYLFDAFLIVPHTLSFPGAFATTGLLGAKMQTTAWLYIFWHGGFPLFVLAYALLRRREAGGTVGSFDRPGAAIALSIAGVAVLATALAALATVGHDLLPVVMRGNDYSLMVTKGVSPAVWVLTLLALAALRQSSHRAVDLWLMLVMWIWLFDIGLAAVIGSSRFDLGFYMGRLFGLIASGFLLLTLVVEMGRLYANGLRTAAGDRRLPASARVTGSERTRTDTRKGRDEPEAKIATSETFIVRQNIARYRDMLVTWQLDDAQRRSIEDMLASEEAKLPRPV